MQFCDECGSMMRNEEGTMVCASCGHREDQDADLAAEFTSTESQDDSDVIESTEESSMEGKPSTETHCKECGHDRAWYDIRQTASADEPPTRFLKCQECGHQWREYN